MRFKTLVCLCAMLLVSGPTQAGCRLFGRVSRPQASYSACAVQTTVRVQSQAVYQTTATAVVVTQGNALGLINQIRARYGLRQLVHDANLAAYAAQNNAHQLQRGLGHHVVPSPQVAGISPSAESVVSQWLASPSHAAILLDPNASTIGIAQSGSAWTANLR